MCQGVSSRKIFRKNWIATCDSSYHLVSSWLRLGSSKNPAWEFVISDVTRSIYIPCAKRLGDSVQSLQNWCLSGLIAATIRNQYDLLCPNNQQPGHTSSHCYCYPIGVTKSSPNGAYDRTSDVRLLWMWRGSSASWDMLSDFGIFWLLDSNVRINYIVIISM